LKKRRVDKSIRFDEPIKKVIVNNEIKNMKKVEAKKRKREMNKPLENNKKIKKN
jgi:hypothetical protein